MCIGEMGEPGGSSIRKYVRRVLESRTVVQNFFPHNGLSSLFYILEFKGSRVSSNYGLGRSYFGLHNIPDHANRAGVNVIMYVFESDRVDVDLLKANSSLIEEKMPGRLGMLTLS
jgi:hypothetical protein